MNQRSLLLRGIDGHLCRLAESVAHRSSTESGRQNARVEMAALLARRRDAATPPRRTPNPEHALLFTAPPGLAVD